MHQVDETHLPHPLLPSHSHTTASCDRTGDGGTVSAPPSAWRPHQSKPGTRKLDTAPYLRDGMAPLDSTVPLDPLRSQPMAGLPAQPNELANPVTGSLHCLPSPHTYARSTAIFEERRTRARPLFLNDHSTCSVHVQGPRNEQQVHASASPCTARAHSKNTSSNKLKMYTLPTLTILDILMS